MMKAERAMTSSSPQPEFTPGGTIQPRAAGHRRQAQLLPGTSDPYLVLGLERNASQPDIKQAYFELVRQYPPEKEPETFKTIRAAYEQLRTAAAQAETDLFLLQTPRDAQVLRIDPVFDLAFHPEDALIALRGWGDLGREDFSDDFREVAL
jgi:curved DNA-binding protein CbpA